MPDKRNHRGPNPRDRDLFSAENLADLRAATADLCLLLSMGYPENASLKLVGDRFALQQRQRMAVARSSCTKEQAESRQTKLRSVRAVKNGPLEIDGFNLLITIESALAGGTIIVGQDGAYRDIASLHGTFRAVEETEPALQMIGEYLGDSTSVDVLWLLDRPVSNSGKIKRLIEELAIRNEWPWEVELVQDPDADLKLSPHTVVTADSVILDHCSSWANLAREIIRSRVPSAQICDLG